MNKIIYTILTLIILVGFIFINKYSKKIEINISNDLNGNKFINSMYNIKDYFEWNAIVVILMIFFYFKKNKYKVVYYWYIILNSYIFIEIISLIFLKYPLSLNNNFNSTSCNCYYSTPNREIFFSILILKLISLEFSKIKLYRKFIIFVFLVLYFFLWTANLKSVSLGNSSIFDYLLGLILAILYHRINFFGKNNLIYSIFKISLTKNKRRPILFLIILVIFFNIILIVLFILQNKFLTTDLDNNIFCSRICSNTIFSQNSLFSSSISFIMIGFLLWIYLKRVKAIKNQNYSINLKKNLFSVIFRIFFIIVYVVFLSIVDNFLFYSIYLSYVIRCLLYIIIGYSIPFLSNFIFKTFYADILGDLGRLRQNIN